jgi:hypothetical protein
MQVAPTPPTAAQSVDTPVKRISLPPPVIITVIIFGFIAFALSY